MENTPYTFTPLQKLWIESLRKHPERKMESSLGKRLDRFERSKPGDYKACCLGELHLCWHRLNKKKLPFVGDLLTDIGSSDHTPDHALDHSYTLRHSYQKYGLHGASGQFIHRGAKEYGFQTSGDYVILHYDQEMEKFYPQPIPGITRPIHSVPDLATLNDHLSPQMTWVAIANLIETYPKMIFTHEN